MPSAISLVFLLYLVVNLVAGIATAVRKRSQMTRKAEPVRTFGQAVQPASEFGFDDADERQAETIRHERRTRETTLQRLHRSDDEMEYGSLEGSDTEGVSLEWDDSVFLDNTESSQAGSALSQAMRPSDGVSTRRLTGVSELSARHLSGDPDQLRAMVIALEVLGKPKGVTM